jgi:superfamily II DNA or RNA helicase
MYKLGKREAHMFQLYDYQQEAFDAAETQILKNLDDARGRMVMPTGAGKTVVQASLLDWQFSNNNKTGIHLVLAPRIMLGNQLLGEYKTILGKEAFRAIAFHSGEHTAEDGVKWKEQATTQKSVVEEAYANAQKLNQQLVVFSTYHSCGKLEGIDFDTIVADESQYCVAENFNASFRSLSGRVRLAFTATEKMTASESGFGLNNEELYGTRWYYISPDELIKKGRIVPPRLHVMRGSTDDEAASIVSQVIEIAKEQIALTNETLDFSKVLFAMSGTDDVKTVEDNIRDIRAEFPDHDIFTITSRNGAQINGVKIKRKQFMQELKDRVNCLIFHYDILSEGIDVDGITGVAIMRNMGLAKLLQTIGRAVRLYKPDPSKKPQAWISVPVINENEDDKERIAFVLRTLRNGGFDISKEDIYETKKERHEKDEDGMDDAYDTGSNNYSSAFIDEVFHEIENDEFWIKVQETNTLDDKLDLFFEEA